MMMRGGEDCRLEVDACGELANTRIVGLNKVSGWVGRRVRTRGGTCIGRTKPSRTTPLRVLKALKNSPRYLEIDSFANGELLEE